MVGKCEKDWLKAPKSLPEFSLESAASITRVVCSSRGTLEEATSSSATRWRGSSIGWLPSKGTSKKSENCDVDLMQLRILRFYDVLRGLEACKDRLVFEYDMGCSKLSVKKNEYLGLEYPRQVRLVDEIEIRGCKTLFCKNTKNKSVISRGNRQIRRSDFTNYKKRNKKLSVQCAVLKQEA